MGGKVFLVGARREGSHGHALFACMARAFSTSLRGTPRAFNARMCARASSTGLNSGPRAPTHGVVAPSLWAFVGPVGSYTVGKRSERQRFCRAMRTRVRIVRFARGSFPLRKAALRSAAAVDQMA